MPAFLERVRGMPRSDATVTFGAIVIVTGFVGTFLGGWLGDLFLTTIEAVVSLGLRHRHAAGRAGRVHRVSTHPTSAVYSAAIAIAEVLIFMCTGPVNSAIINVVSPMERATAVGLSVLVMHVLGDIPSPPLIGCVSDTQLAGARIPDRAGGDRWSRACIWSYAAWRGERAPA